VGAKLVGRRAEFYGLLQAIKWISNLGLHNVIFELDAKVVVDNLNKSQLNLSRFSFIARDCIFHFNHLCHLGDKLIWQLTNYLGCLYIRLILRFFI